jgi:hypothetical protein
MTVQFFETLRGLGDSIGRGSVHRRITTVYELTRGHGSVLAQFRGKPGRWVLNIDTDNYTCSDCGHETARFLQFMALEDGMSVIGECISNQFLDEHHKFTTGHEAALRSFGWSDPLPGQDPNWYFEANSTADLLNLDDMTNRTLREVFELHD